MLSGSFNVLISLPLKADSPMVFILLFSPKLTLVRPALSNEYSSIEVRLVALLKSSVVIFAFGSAIDSSADILGSELIIILKLSNPSGITSSVAVPASSAARL